MAKHLTIGEGLPNGFVRCVFQDSRQFMWFGDRYGLAFYDGQGFRYRKIGHVQGICEDPAGILWVHHAHTLSRLDPETDRFKKASVFPVEEKSQPKIFSIQQHPDSDDFWVFTRTNNVECLARAVLFDPIGGSIRKTVELSGLAANSRCLSVADGAIWARGIRPHILKRFDLTTNETREYDLRADSVADFVIECIYCEGGRTWVLTTNGVLHRLEKNERKAFSFVATRGRSGLIGPGATSPICKDRAGNLWIATDGFGLFRFEKNSERFVSFRHDASDPYSINSDRISGIYRDRNGMFWLNTQGAGVDCLLPEGPTVQHISHDPETDQSLGHPAVWAVFQDYEGICWFGHEDGLDRFDPKHSSFLHFKESSDDENTISAGRNVSVIFEDTQHRLWVGSWNGGLNLFDRKAGKFKHYNHDEDDASTLQSDRISAIMEDQEHNLWVGTTRGLARYDESQDHFLRVPVTLSPTEDASSNRLYLRTIVELPDEPGVLWLGCWDELGLVRFEVAANRATHFVHDPEDATTLSHNTIRVIHPAKGGMWVGTADGLNKFDRTTKQFTRYTSADGMPSNAVCGIAECENGTLWISTSRGLCKFLPSSSTFKSLGAADGVRVPEFIQRSYFHGKDGTLYFGGTNGVCVLDPRNVKPHHYSAPLRITGFKLFDDTAIESRGPRKHVWASDEIILRRHQDVFSFEFSTLNYLQKHLMRYRYRLRGFQDEWTEVGPNERVATYTNLRPGNYTFEVNQALRDGVWQDDAASIKLSIRPSWWETLLFKVFLVAALLFGSIVIYRNRIRTYQRQTKRFSDLYVALKQEVKEREQAVRDFQAVSNKFTRLFLDAREAIYFSTPAGQLLDINPAGVALLGYDDKSEVLSTTTMELLGIDEATQADFFRRIKQSGFASDFELPIRRKDGQQLFVVVSASAVLDHDGKVQEIHGIVYDLTRKKELESQLFQSQKMEAVGTLAAGVAHDFNNLLSVIMTNAEIIKHTEEGKLSAENNAILLACSSAARLTNQLLTYSRQDASYQRATPTSVANVVRDVADLVSSTMPSTMTLRTSLDPRAGSVTADPAQLQQIAMNLCTNAVQALGSQTHGDIEISVQPKNLKGETTTGSFRRLDGPHVELRVRDNGVGIAEEALGRLFDPFYTTRDKGTGLGLSVVHGIVEELGGRVDVISQPGKGSEFVVLLPESESHTSELGNRFVGAHILLADDEPAVRIAFEKILVAQGYRVSSARNGYEAMQLLNGAPDSFDIIVTDERMPEMTGIEFAEQARTIRPDIPVLLISGHAVNQPNIADSRLLQGFIRKPIKASELHKQIQMTFRQHSVLGLESGGN